MTQPAILVVGSLNADLVVQVPRFPSPAAISGGGSSSGRQGANRACAADGLAVLSRWSVRWDDDQARCCASR
jgi:sugar/nucleoside kinase (ribokinase family)